MRSLFVIALLALVACGPKKPPAAAGASQPAPSSRVAPTLGGQPAGAVAAPQLDRRADAERNANQAVALLTTGSIENARQSISLLQAVQADYPGLPTVAFDLGIAWESLGDSSRSEAYFRQATALDPTYAPAWLHLGLSAEKHGKLVEAQQAYQDGVSRCPKDIDLRVAQVAILIRMKRFEEAISVAKAALQVNANALNIYANLGLAYIEENKLDLAKFIYLRAMNAVEGADSNAHIHAYLGRIYYLQGYFVDARKELEAALKLDPNHVPALVYLSEYYLDNRSFDQMIPLLEHARALEPNDLAVRMDLGIAYRGVGRYDDALREYQAVLQLDPARAEPWLNISILYGDYQKKYPEALDALQRYKSSGGPDTAKADAWIAGLQKEQEMAAKLEKHKKEAEEIEKKKAEEKKFLEDFQKKQKEDEERARLLKESTPAVSPPAEPVPGQPTAPQPAAAPVEPSGVWSTEPAPPAPSPATGSPSAAPPAPAPAPAKPPPAPAEPSPTVESSPAPAEPEPAPATPPDSESDGLGPWGVPSSEGDTTPPASP
jgi:tetratricopeptide (TPR) repeat protein